MTETKLARMSAKTARTIGERQARQGGNPFDWTTERHLHDAWAAGHLAVARTMPFVPVPDVARAVKAVEMALESRLTFPSKGSDMVSVRAVIDALYIVGDTADAPRAVEVMRAADAAYKAAGKLA